MQITKLKVSIFLRLSIFVKPPADGKIKLFFKHNREETDDRTSILVNSEFEFSDDEYMAFLRTYLTAHESEILAINGQRRRFSCSILFYILSLRFTFI